MVTSFVVPGSVGWPAVAPDAGYERGRTAPNVIDLTLRRMGIPRQELSPITDNLDSYGGKP